MRSYGDPCGVARALDVLGRRWSPLVVRELLLGAKRFSDLAAGLPGVSPNVLDARLRELMAADLLIRVPLGPPARGLGYELTERGRELEPVLLALARWGARQPLPDGGELSPDALVLALRTTFDPAATADLALQLDLRLDADRLTVDLDGGQLTIRRGAAPDPTVTAATATPTLRGLVFGGRSLASAAAAEEISVEGDRPGFERFLSAFTRPGPA